MYDARACVRARRFSTYCVDTGQLHADVDHRDGDDLPADAAVYEQAPDGDRVDGRQRALLLLHLLHLRLDVFIPAVPLQG